MSEHTPGPWVYDLAWGTVVANGPVSMVICDPPGQSNRGPNGEPGPAEQDFHDANARLIAAAPDLLAALVDVLPDLEHYVSTHGPGPDRRLDAARKAIAKARG